MRDLSHGEGFGDRSLDPEVEAGDLDVAPGHGRQQEHGDAVPLADLAQQVEAVDVRHRQVDERDVDRSGAQQAERAGTVRSAENFPSVVAELESEQPSERRIAADDECARRLAGRRLAVGG
jgi:hypothetical protein